KDDIKTAEANAKKDAQIVLSGAIERVKGGERPTAEQGQRLDVWPKGYEQIAASRSLGWSGPREHFVITPDWIWHTLHNGADGDDWSWNNVAGYIVHRIPFDAEFAQKIREAATLLGYQTEVDDQ